MGLLMPPPPKNPEDFDKVNYVIDSWTHACEAPWYIYIETLKPALLEAFIVLISFGWADVIRGRFRPKGLGRRTGKRKGRWARRVPRFPELGNTLGKALPFGEQLDDFIKWGTKTKFLWRIDNAAQASLFFWLVADVAEDFVFNWTSLLYKTYWCQRAHLGRFSYADTGQSGKSENVWWHKGYFEEDYEKPFPSWAGRSGWSGANGCTVAATATWNEYLGFPKPTDTAIRIYDLDSAVVFAEESAFNMDPADDPTLVVFGEVPGNKRFGVATWHEPSWAWVGNGIITAEEVP